MRGSRPIKPLEIVHFDVYGPMKTLFMDGARYLMTFIDYLSERIWLYALKFNGKCFEKFKEFKSLVET